MSSIKREAGHKLKSCWLQHQRGESKTQGGTLNKKSFYLLFTWHFLSYRRVMSIKYVIEGGHRLKGVVRVNGSKNAALPMLAATLLTDEPCIIKRVPMITDVKLMLDILRQLGSVVKIDDHTVTVQTQKVVTTQIPDDLASKLRASILLMGPLLARAGKIQIRHPGGCVIGKRPVGTHFEALRSLGARFEQDDSRYWGQAGELTGAKMFLGEASVTATENAMMAAATARGTTVIEPAACEPHIVSLGKMIEAMGANVEGLGTHTITIKGATSLKGGTFEVNADEIEAGTLAIALGITHGNGIIESTAPENMGAICWKLGQFGITTNFDGKDMHVKASDTFRAAPVKINVWPVETPTDIQPQLTVLATQAEGTSLIHDWMYDRRLMYIDELAKLGATILLCDPHRALVSGPTKLRGKTILSPDIRAGVAFILAGLVAHGTTTIGHAELIERGYEDIVGRLNGLGAKIDRIETLFDI